MRKSMKKFLFPVTAFLILAGPLSALAAGSPSTHETQSSVANIPQGLLQNALAQDLEGQPRSVTFSSNDTPGSLLVAHISGQLNADSLPTGNITVTDSVGNVWHEVTYGWVLYCCKNPGHYQFNSMWWAQNTKGRGSEKITIKVAWYHGGISSFYNVQEYYSSAGLYTLDGNAYGLQQSIMARPGSYTLVGSSITPSANNDLIIAFAVDDDGGGVDKWSPGTGFSPGYQWLFVGNPLAYTEYMIQGTAAKISPTFNFSSTTSNVHLTCIAAAFKTQEGGAARDLTTNIAGMSSTAPILQGIVRSPAVNIASDSSVADVLSSISRKVEASVPGASSTQDIANYHSDH